MKLNLDTIRTLDANKSYYIANSTGEIKEAGAWQKFKCALGVGDGRRKAARLVDAVKTALLNEAGMVENDEMEGALDGLRNRSVSGSALKEIAERFAVANKGAIRKTMESRAVAEAMANAGKALDRGKREEVEALVKSAIAECGGDKDAAAVVARNIDNVLVGGDNRLRDADGVKKKVAGIKANFDELKQVAKGDANIIKIGAEFIDTLGGSSVPKGYITALVNAAKSANLGEVKNLNGHSSAYGIHCALKDLDKAISTGLGKLIETYNTNSADERQASIRFFTMLAVASLGEKTCANIRAALATKGASEIARTYKEFLNASRIPAFVETDGTLCRGISEASIVLRNALNELKMAIDLLAGVPAKDVKFVEAVKGEFGVDPGVVDELKEDGRFIVLKGAVTKNAAYRAKFREMGYAMSESPKLANAVALYSLATGCTVEEAVNEVLTPGTKANRLMEYGGRFTESVENFKDGLKLMDTFKEWFDGMVAVRNGDAPKKTVSHFNVSVSPFDADGDQTGFERFVFEDIAIDGKFNLKETKPEKAFGFENNAASRFFGRYFYETCTCTVAQVPPEKRRVLFAAFDALIPLAKTAKAADAQRRLDVPGVLTGRILKNFDAVAALVDSGTLTAKSLIEVCYPDFQPATMDANGLNAFDDLYASRAMNELGPEAVVTVQQMLISSGDTLDNVIAAVKESRELPAAPYVSSVSGELTGFGVAATGGRKQMLADIERPEPHKKFAKGSKMADPFVKKDDDNCFGFTFPGEARIKTNYDDKYKTNCKTVADKVEALCGKGHARQSSAVMFALSQAELGKIKGALMPYGVKSTEHSPVEYTLSKDANTGAVKIDIKSPDYLPVKFSWSVTVSIDGTTVSTPMQIEKKAAA